MKKRFSDEQIISILREAEAGVSARELCRKHAISDATFYTWRKKYGCSGQQKLATALEFFQNNRSDSFGVKPPLY